MRECICSNACYAIGDCNRFKCITATESILPNIRYGVGNSGFFTSSDKSICSSLDDGIAIIPTIIYCIVILNLNGFKGLASTKNILSYTLDILRNSDGG